MNHSVSGKSVIMLFVVNLTDRRSEEPELKRSRTAQYASSSMCCLGLLLSVRAFVLFITLRVKTYFGRIAFVILY